MNKENNSNIQIRNGAILSYVGIALGITITMLYMPWMVERIGKSDYAIYTLANSFVGIFLVDFGLSAAVSKFIAQYRAEGQKEKIQWLLSCVFELYFVIDIFAIFIFCILYFFLPEVYQGLTSQEMELYRVVYVMVVVYSICSFPFVPITGVLGAYEKYVEMQWINIVQKVTTVLVGVFGLLIWNDVKVVVSTNIVIGFLSILAKVVVAGKSVNLHFQYVRIRWLEIKEIVGFSIWSTIMGIANRFTFSIAPTMLGIVSSSEQIALFAPANALESYFYTIAAAINGFFLPKISRYVVNDEKDKLTELMIRVGRYQTALMGMVFCSFCVVGKEFIGMWMGKDFADATKCAIVLFIPDLFSFSQQIANTTVIAENQIQKYSYGHIMMALVSIGFMLVLGEPLGAFGIALSIALAYVVQFLWSNYIYNKYLSIDMVLFYRKCYLQFLLPVFIFTVITVFVLSKISLSSVFAEFMIKLILIIILYVALMFVLSDEREKTVVKSLLRGGKNESGNKQTD